MVVADRVRLLRESTKTAAKRPGPQCVVCKLPEDIRAEIGRLIEEGDRHTSISKGLKAIGLDVPAQRLSWHFRSGHEQAK